MPIVAPMRSSEAPITKGAERHAITFSASLASESRPLAATRSKVPEKDDQLSLLPELHPSPDLGEEQSGTADCANGHGKAKDQCHDAQNRRSDDRCKVQDAAGQQSDIGQGGPGTANRVNVPPLIIPASSRPITSLFSTESCGNQVRAGISQSRPSNALPTRNSI